MNQPTGLVAILRGVRPDEILAIGSALIEAGFPAIEIPLNSPQPFDSIERLAAASPSTCVVGAGTVLTVDDVVRAESAGARIIVAPNADQDVIAAAVTRGLRPYPGVATPTEAFRAVAAGAISLKLFPSNAVGISGMSAWRSVLPTNVEMLPVGGVDEHNLAEWAAAGAGGAGIGSSLYRPGDEADVVGRRARALTHIWSEAERNA
ncbi:2-dehydro-3-deoxy-6-phosphogalactonate aldolase [Mycobacterium sp. 21AC1]|uniref:2-dehydro-3-deoxy-6-phosphogalactonate aldolase n=1 Tax=[Mycobacterium] appelbergii TaxID=2939269 RepID=UPI002938E848|nr:2-dehydro-3-deoxy-6-phosphogalactonate aldolase [Mycobacterium sp. 21AC1]MDV3124090.1 2-dehydro-3-deoxy-6-phosphogalactonate aldolase [Mycobacterium sp. 21AC1]